MKMDFITIIKYAWLAYDSSREISKIGDMSKEISTNHVYRIFHRFQSNLEDAWVVFYRPIKIKHELPKMLKESDIEVLAKEMATFHKSCHTIRNTLPYSAKNMTTDINELLAIVDKQYPKHAELIKQQCQIFLDNTYKINSHGFDKIPVFVDWNIGNFSVSSNGRFYSRWDYDWFRMSSRIVDFYYLSRVVSSQGNRDDESFEIDTLMEDRFLHFLKVYHSHYPLKKEEVQFIKESYRFLLLNYVIKSGKFIFNESHARKLQQLAFDEYFKDIDEKFNENVLLDAIGLGVV